MNEFDTLYFESYSKFSDLKENDIKGDCFYKVLSRLSKEVLDNLFGFGFMEDERWLEQFIS